MKKVYDWDIRIGIYVDSCKKKFSMICSVHTIIHEVALKTAHLLELDGFDTKIDFFFRSPIPLKPVSTLYQNDIKDNDVITARVIQTKKINTIPEDITDKKIVKSKTTQCYGLTLICTCVEPKCINYGKDVSVPLGTGQFQFTQILNTTKCQVCPYRDQLKNPPMVVKSIELNHCVWKIQGTHLYKGFPTHHVQGFKKVIQKHNFYDYLRKYKWQNDIILTIKDL